MGIESAAVTGILAQAGVDVGEGGDCRRNVVRGQRDAGLSSERGVCCRGRRATPGQGLSADTSEV